jgi:hypothetical protein
MARTMGQRSTFKSHTAHVNTCELQSYLTIRTSTEAPTFAARARPLITPPLIMLEIPLEQCTTPLQKPSLLPTRPSAPETEAAPPMIYPPLSSLITNGRSFSRRVDGASPMWCCELLGDAVAWLLAIYFGHAGQASCPIFLHMSNFEFQCLPSIQLGTPRCGSN